MLPSCQQFGANKRHISSQTTDWLWYTETPVREKNTETYFVSVSFNILMKQQMATKINSKESEIINWDSNVLCGSRHWLNRNVELQGGMEEAGAVVDLLPGVDSFSASVPSSSMEA